MSGRPARIRRVGTCRGTEGCQLEGEAQPVAVAPPPLHGSPVSIVEIEVAIEFRQGRLTDEPSVAILGRSSRHAAKPTFEAYGVTFDSDVPHVPIRSHPPTNHAWASGRKVRAWLMVTGQLTVEADIFGQGLPATVIEDDPIIIDGSAAYQPSSEPL